MNRMGVVFKLTSQAGSPCTTSTSSGAGLRFDRLPKTTTTRAESGRFAPILVTTGLLARRPLVSALQIVLVRSVTSVLQAASTTPGWTLQSRRESRAGSIERVAPRTERARPGALWRRPRRCRLRAEARMAGTIR